MSKILILLLFISICTVANNQTMEDNCTDCKANFSDIKKEDILTSSPNVSNDEIGVILQNALKKIRLYKKEKNSEIKKVNNRLESIIKEFAEYRIKKNREIKKLKSELANYKKYSSREKKIETTESTLQTPLTWVEIIVEDGVDIFQLAEKYYGDRDEYRQIYLANRDTIGENFQITDGMSLKIPIVNQFEEQPMILNRD